MILYRAADINMYLGKGMDYKLIHPLTKKVCNQPKYGYPKINKLIGWYLSDNELLFEGNIEYISKDKIKCGNLILNVNEKKYLIMQIN